MFGTNPIAVTIPADPHPFHMDFATSVMTCGKMEVYAKIGHELQPGMLVDETGTTCLDPNVFLRIRDNKSNPAYTEKTRGGIMPMGGEGMLFGGHKGYGLALLVDIMCAVMSHGAVSKGVRVTKDKEKCCHFFAASGEMPSTSRSTDALSVSPVPMTLVRLVLIAAVATGAAM